MLGMKLPSVLVAPVKACSGHRVEQECLMKTLWAVNVRPEPREPILVSIRSPEGYLLQTINLAVGSTVEFPQGIPLFPGTIVSAFSVEGRHPKLYPNGKFFRFQPFQFIAFVFDDEPEDVLFYHPV